MTSVYTHATLPHERVKRVDFSEVARRMGITRSWEGWGREEQGVGVGAGNRRKSLWCSVAQWMKCGGQNLNTHFIYDKEFENVPLGEITCASL